MRSRDRFMSMYEGSHMSPGQLGPCEHDALLRIGGESHIRRELQNSRGVSRNWACPGIGQVTSSS
jgi:hypothetical protein